MHRSRPYLVGHKELRGQTTTLERLRVDRQLEVVASRPGTLTVTTLTGEVDRAYRDLVAHLNPT